MEDRRGFDPLSYCFSRRTDGFVNASYDIYRREQPRRRKWLVALGLLHAEVYRIARPFRPWLGGIAVTKPTLCP
jgi:hypothetical protein